MNAEQIPNPVIGMPGLVEESTSQKICVRGDVEFMQGFDNPGPGVTVRIQEPIATESVTATAT